MQFHRPLETEIFRPTREADLFLPEIYRTFCFMQRNFYTKGFVLFGEIYHLAFSFRNSWIFALHLTQAGTIHDCPHLEA